MTRLLAVYDGNDALLMRFQYADARTPVAMVKSGVTYNLAHDQVGTLRAVVDSAGTLVKQLDHDSFGNLLSDSNPAFSVPLGFAGGLIDADTGLVRFGYRDYDPNTGRWTAKDPIGFAGGDADLFEYCLSDPVNNNDPDGRIVVPLALIGTVIAVSTIAYYIWDFIENIKRAAEKIDKKNEADNAFNAACEINDTETMEDAYLDSKRLLGEGLVDLERATVDGANIEYGIGRQLHRGAVLHTRQM